MFFSVSELVSIFDGFFMHFRPSSSCERKREYRNRISFPSISVSILDGFFMIFQCFFHTFGASIFTSIFGRILCGFRDQLRYPFQPEMTLDVARVRATCRQNRRSGSPRTPPSLPHVACGAYQAPRVPPWPPWVAIWDSFVIFLGWFSMFLWSYFR